MASSNGFHNGQKAHRGWRLFQCWRCHDSDTQPPSNAFLNKNSHRTGRWEFQAKKSAESQPSAAPVSDAKPNEFHRESSAEQVEEGSVDREAQEFIEKMRRKMNMEALKSMKRYESMMRRGY